MFLNYKRTKCPLINPSILKISLLKPMLNCIYFTLLLCCKGCVQIKTCGTITSIPRSHNQTNLLLYFRVNLCFLSSSLWFLEWVFSVRVTKITSKISVSWTQSIFLFWTYLKPDNFESHNSLKLNFTNIQGLHLNFVEGRVFSSSLLHAIITQINLPLFKTFSNFVYFCLNFQKFCPL